MDGTEGSRATNTARSTAGLTVWIAGSDRDDDRCDLALRLLHDDGLDAAVEPDGTATRTDGASRERPDALLLIGDASASDLVDDIRRVRDRLPQAAVVVVAAAPNGNGVRAALRAGAKGFTLASRMTRTLAITVRAACAGQVAVPHDLLAHMAPPLLSFREKQVLGMVVLGFTNQEIAAKLHLTESTVKSHLSSSFRKLGVRSRKEAAAMILDTRSGLGPGILTAPREPVAGSVSPAS